MRELMYRRKPEPLQILIAIVKGHLEVLQTFKRFCGQRFVAILLDLLQLALDVKNREMVKYFINIGATDAQQRNGYIPES